MNIQEIEKRISELLGKQSDHFKKKKADRNATELEAVRTELNDLKKQATELYKKAKASNKKELKQQA